MLSLTQAAHSEAIQQGISAKVYTEVHSAITFTWGVLESFCSGRRHDPFMMGEGETVHSCGGGGIRRCWF